MKLDLQLKQTQALSPQMLQSISILQMGALELEQYAEQQLLENPVLEQAPPPVAPQPVQESLLDRVRWLAGQDRQNLYYHQSDWNEDNPDFSNRFARRDGESLADHLRTQLRFDRISSEAQRCISAIIDALSPNGYFDEDIHDFSLRQAFSPATVLQALEQLQTLEPAGVGARNLSECLCLQLLRESNSDLALVIAREHLQLLAQHRYATIARLTGASRLAVGAACDKIRSLNPKPGAQFDVACSVEYIVPDLLVIKSGAEYILYPNEPEPLSLQINGYYALLHQTSQDKQLNNYLEEKLRQARWLIQGIAQRSSTLRHCAKCIIAWQQSFFQFGPGHLHPMTLRDLAQNLSLHESTISRAVREKYLQCDHGVFPLSYFFTRSLNTENQSTDQARALLSHLIQGENKAAPLSDQKLSDLMKKQGTQISRRTVAKYRDQLHIPGASARQQF